MTVRMNVRRVEYFTWTCDQCGNTYTHDDDGVCASNKGWDVQSALGKGDRCPVCVLWALGIATEDEGAGLTRETLEQEHYDELLDLSDGVPLKPWFWYVLDGDGSGHCDDADTEMDAAAALLAYLQEECLLDDPASVHVAGISETAKVRSDINSEQAKCLG